jgi:hypothetical protein
VTNEKTNQAQCNNTERFRTGNAQVNRKIADGEPTQVPFSVKTGGLPLTCPT